MPKGTVLGERHFGPKLAEMKGQSSQLNELSAAIDRLRRELGYDSAPTVYERKRAVWDADRAVKGMGPEYWERQEAARMELQKANPREFTILELAEKVLAATGSRSKLVFRPLPTDDPIQRRPDITLAYQELGGWNPTVMLDEGLRKTISYFSSYI